MGSSIIDPYIETLTQNGDPWSKSKPHRFIPVKETRYIFNGQLVGAQDRFGLFWERKIFLATLILRTPDHPALILEIL
jgi:hypothetical protein